MSLHDPNFATDKHLQTALRNAPDQDLAPSESVRERVLNYANNAVKPASENWLKRFINSFVIWRVKSWQVAGMGALASVFLVIVMVREQAPEESIWVKSEVKDVARNRADAPAASAPQQDKIEAPARIEGLQAEAKRSAPVEEALTKKLAETTASVSASAAPELADKADVAVAAAKVPEPVVTASAPETEAKQVLSRTAPASAPMMREMAADENPVALTLIKPSELIKQGGEAVAKKDLEAGNLRMLKIETQDCPQPTKHESSVDMVTNYKVMVLEVCATDEKAHVELLHRQVEVYNQTMLNWYQTHKE